MRGVTTYSTFRPLCLPHNNLLVGRSSSSFLPRYPSVHSMESQACPPSASVPPPTCLGVICSTATAVSLDNSSSGLFPLAWVRLLLGPLVQKVSCVLTYCLCGPVYYDRLLHVRLGKEDRCLDEQQGWSLGYGRAPRVENCRTYWCDR